MVSNAHEKTPHRIGQIEKARIECAAILEAAGAGQERSEPLAAEIVDVLQNLGWTPPHDPAADRPPLTGRGAPDDSPGRQAARAAAAAIAARRNTPRPAVSLSGTTSAIVDDVPTPGSPA